MKTPQNRENSTDDVLLEGAPAAALSHHSARPFSHAQLEQLLGERDEELRAALRQSAQLQQSLEQRERQIEAMHQVSETMFQNLDLDVMARRTLEMALQVLGAEAGSLQLYNAEHDTLVFQYVVGPAAETLTGYVMPAAQGLSGQVLRTGVPDITKHVSQLGGLNPMWRHNSQSGRHNAAQKDTAPGENAPGENAPGENAQNDAARNGIWQRDVVGSVAHSTGARSEVMATVPLRRPGGDSIGVMQLLKASDADINRSDLEVLQVLCGQAAAAIETARLAQEARKAELAGVIGDVAHDIKNMMTPIQTGLWTLQPMLDQLFADLDVVRFNCQGRAAERDIERAASLVRDSYEWIFNAALDACDQLEGRTREIADAIKGELAPPVFQLGDLNQTVGEVARPLFLLADKTNVHLHFDLDPALPQAEFDGKQIYNALYNLVNNALAETSSGQSVTIRTRGPEAGENTLLLEVEDTGRGMPEHVRARLFTDQAVSTKAGGTGLGTRIVAGVVRRHQGRISVQSEVGRGSTFSICLPLRRSHEEEIQTESSTRLPQRRHNLPSLATPLIGRVEELRQARQLLLQSPARLLTLTGTGGMGKSRLALQIAHDLLAEFEDGVWFVPLAAVDDPLLVASALSATLGVRQEPGRALPETLIDALRAQRKLLLLDNFEQVLPASSLVNDLLEACPELRVLVTSRSRLSLPGEQEMSLSPLPLPDFERAPEHPTSGEALNWAQCEAVSLFVERASGVRPFALTAENARDVADICARLDGLPLAIELAAVRTAAFSTSEIRQRLAQRLPFLETDRAALPSELPARHQTLRATIDWSYDLLPPQEQQLLPRVMVFESGCTLAAAQAVCGGADASHDTSDAEASLAAALLQLVNKNLLRRNVTSDGETWFWVLETIREYGLEKLAASGEEDLMRRRFAEYYLAVAQSAHEQRIRSPEAGPLLPGVPSADAEPALWSAWRKREDPNLRAALAWLQRHAEERASEKKTEDRVLDGPPYGALRMALSLRDIWVGDHWNERREALQHALEKSVDAPDALRLRAMLFVGDLAVLQADYERAREFGQKSLDLSRQCGDQTATARSLGILGNVALAQGDFAQARALHSENLAYYRAQENAGATAWALYHLGVVAKRAGDIAASQDFFAQSLAAFRGENDREGIGWALLNLGTVEYRREESSPSRRLLEEALAIFRETQNKHGQARTLSFLGKMAGQEGDFATARTHLSQSMELARQLGDRENIASTLWNSGDVALAEGDTQTARTLFREVAQTLQALSDTPRLGALLRSLARLARIEGNMERTARLLGAFDALKGDALKGDASTNHQNHPVGNQDVPSEQRDSQNDESWLSRETMLARGVLGEVAFFQAWNQGRLLTLEQALGEALDFEQSGTLSKAVL